MIRGFRQLREALESIGFNPPKPEYKSVDDGDFDDDTTEHEYQERRRLFTA